jgi:hypothetical protein
LPKLGDNAIAAAWAAERVLQPAQAIAAALAMALPAEHDDMS